MSGHRLPFTDICKIVLKYSYNAHVKFKYPFKIDLTVLHNDEFPEVLFLFFLCEKSCSAILSEIKILYDSIVMYPFPQSSLLETIY